MNKIKEHHDVERQVRGWQIALPEGAFSAGMGQALGWEQGSSFPLLSLSVLFCPVISPAPHLSPLPEAHVKARVSPPVKVSAACREVSFVQQGRPAQPLGSRCLQRSKSSSAASCLEKLLLLFSSGTSDEISVSTPQCPFIPVQFLAACFQPRAGVNSEGFFPLLSSLCRVTWCHILG